MWEKRRPTSCSWWLTGNWPPRYFGQRTIIWTESDIQSSEKRNFCSQAIKSLKHASTWNPISSLDQRGPLAFHFGLGWLPMRGGGDLCKVRRLKGPAMGSIARLWGVYRGSHWLHHNEQAQGGLPLPEKALYGLGWQTDTEVTKKDSQANPRIFPLEEKRCFLKCQQTELLRRQRSQIDEACEGRQGRKLSGQTWEGGWGGLLPDVLFGRWIGWRAARNPSHLTCANVHHERAPYIVSKHHSHLNATLRDPCSVLCLTSSLSWQT